MTEETRLGALETHVELLIETNQKLTKILLGNGSRGLVGRVDIIWHSYVWIIGLFCTAAGMVIMHLFGH